MVKTFLAFLTTAGIGASIGLGMLQTPAMANGMGTILLQDDFTAENGGAGVLNYFGFANWDVTDGSVDLLGNTT